MLTERLQFQPIQDVTLSVALLRFLPMTHPLVSRLAPMMDGDLQILHQIVAEWVLSSPSDSERTVLRYFGAELGAVQRRIQLRHQLRQEPPTEEEIEIALTAVFALMKRRATADHRLS